MKPKTEPKHLRKHTDTKYITEGSQRYDCVLTVREKLDRGYGCVAACVDVSVCVCVFVS